MTEQTFAEAVRESRVSEPTLERIAALVARLKLHQHGLEHGGAKEAQIQADLLAAADDLAALLQTPEAPDLRPWVHHMSSCAQYRGAGGTCFAPGPVQLEWGVVSCRLTIGHEGHHANGSHEWPDRPCTCGLSVALQGREREN